MNFIVNHKLGIVIVALSIWTIASLVIISDNEKKIKRQRYEIIDLEDKVSSKGKIISELENDKEELESRISDLEDNSNSNSNYSSSYQNQTYSSSSFNGNEIDESEAFKVLGSATVVYKQNGCDYMILENSSGFIFAEWMGGNDPDQGDNIAGNFKSYGTKEFYNDSRRSKTKLWVDDYMLSKESALEKMNDKCH